MTIGTKTPEIRSASRWTWVLPCCASSTSRAIWASCVSRPDPGRAHDQPAAGVDGRAGDLVAGPDLDRHRLPRQHRRVDGRRAALDDAVGRDLLARPDHEHVTDDQSVDRHPGLGEPSTPSGSSATSLRPEVHQRAQRRAGPALGPALEPATGQQEGRDARGRLEVDRVEPVAALHGQLERVGHPDLAGRCRRTGRPATSRTPPARPPRRACPSWSRRAGGWPTRPGGTARPPQTTTGVARVSDAHCQSSNWRAGTIAISDDRDGEQRGDDQPLLQPRPARGRRRPSGSGVGLPAGAGSAAAYPAAATVDEQVVGGDRLGVGHPRLLGRVVDARGDAVELVELALDPVGARRAGHPGDVELDLGWPWSVLMAVPRHRGRAVPVARLDADRERRGAHGALVLELQEQPVAPAARERRGERDRRPGARRPRRGGRARRRGRRRGAPRGGRARRGTGRGR